MHIWQIDPANLTAYYDRALCQALADQQHTVRFITSRYLYEELSYPTTFRTEFHYFRWLEHPLWRKFSRLRKVFRTIGYPLAHRQLLMKIKQERPDIVHLQWSRLPVFDRWLVRQMQKLHIPVVHTVHDALLMFSQGTLTGQLADVYTIVDALIVHTQDSYQKLLNAYPGIDPARVFIIPLIPDKSPDSQDIPVNASQELARQRLGIPQDTSMLLFFGSVKTYKGLDILVAALPKLAAVAENFQVWVAGYPETPEDARQLEALSRYKNVVIHPHYIPTSDMWLYYFAADVVVFPYRNIFQSAALMTALVHGCAVIVTEVGGLPEMVDGNGWIIPPEDPAALADVMIEALQDRERLKQMGQRSRELVAERFSSTRIAQQHIEIYRSLL